MPHLLEHLILSLNKTHGSTSVYTLEMYDLIEMQNTPSILAKEKTK